MTEASFDTLTLAFDPRGVATVTLARGEAGNVLDDLVIDELTWAFTVLAADARVRVIVLAAEGSAFSLGVDLAWMQRAGAHATDVNLADARRFAAMLQTLHECPKPVVARVHGAAYGAGMGICCACDLVLAAPQARFAFTETSFGLVPSIVAPYVLGAIGKRQAQRLALTAQSIDATRAAEIGIVTEVVSLEEMDRAVERLVAQLLANGPQALAETKQLFRELSLGRIDADAREQTAQTITRVRATDEAKEGFAAFLDKRPASWTEQAPPLG